MQGEGEHYVLSGEGCWLCVYVDGVVGRGVFCWG